MISSLAGRVAIVTGGASGLGHAIASALATAGAKVLVADRDGPRAHRAAAGFGAIAVEVDVCDAAAVADMVTRCVAELGEPEVLINCAGVTLGKDFLDIELAQWRRVLAVNLEGCFIVSQAVARRMAKCRRGSIVNIASVTGERATSGRAAYAASKGGLIMLTKSMAVDLARHGIRVNALAPGAFDTPLAAQHHAGESEFIRHAYMAQTPLARYGRPEELAPAALFLAGDDARYITGTVLPVDGGFLAAGMLRGDPA